MVRAAIGFFVLALIAMLLGVNGIAGVSLEVGKILLGVFLFLAIVSFVTGMFTGKKSKQIL